MHNIADRPPENRLARENMVLAAQNVGHEKKDQEFVPKYELLV